MHQHLKKRPTYGQRLIYALTCVLLATCTSSATGVRQATRLLIQRTDYSLWLFPIDGGAGQQLTPALTPGDDVVTWSLSPDQQWLAYIQARNWRKEGADRGQAFLLNIATGEKRVLLDAMLPQYYDWGVGPWDADRAIIEGKPVWSKDSQRFTLISDQTGGVGLYVYTLRTHDLRLLTQGQRNIAWPQWSPDEQYILYNDVDAFGTGAGPNGGALWVVPSIGPSRARRLSQTDEHLERISGWQDQTHVLTYKTSFTRGNWDESVVDLQNGERTAVPAQPASPVHCWRYTAETNQLTWRQPTTFNGCNTVLAPQGHWAYALVSPTMNEDQLYLIQRASVARTLLAETKWPPQTILDPLWSPDGHYLTWLTLNAHSTPSAAYTLWAVQVEKQQPFRVAERVAFWEKPIWIK